MKTPPDWLTPDQPYLLGISGGRDSMVLHHWLTAHHFTNLTCCHLNHGLRGPESDQDQSFLRDHLGDHLLAQKTDVADLARREKLSLETAARQARHSFFESCAQSTGISGVLLAHHADDQAETILFNLLRGSAGPKGMMPRHRIGKLTFLRPLLHTRRSEIDSYLTQNEIAFREDSSNSDPFAARNRLRHEAFPLLAEILGRDPAPALLRAHQHTRDLDDLAQTLLDEAQILDPRGRIHLPTFRALSVPLQKKALHQFLRQHRITELSAELIDEGLTLTDPDSPPAINLPGGLRLRRKEARLFISP